MKKITFLLVALFVGAISFAQISEDFDDSALPDGWSTVVNTGDCDFSFAMEMPTGPDFESVGIIFDDDACGSTAAASNVTLFTAVYDLTSNTGDLEVRFDVAFQEVGSGETFTVEAYTGEEWETLVVYDTDLAEITSASFPIAENTADYQLRFTYDDAADWGWHAAIDNFTIDEVLSTGDETLANFSMFPNPAVNELTVTSSTTIQNVKVFNLLGQVVLDQKVNALSQTLDVTALKSGAYLVQVSGEGQTGTYKLLKQ